MKVTLFAGHHKVGSTALQQYLAYSAPALLRDGVLYPVVSGSDLGRLEHGAPLSERLLGLDRNVSEAHSALAFSLLQDAGRGRMPNFHSGGPATDEMISVINRQVADHSARHLILVSEVFSTLAANDPASITRLVEGLHLQRHEVELVFYLRRVDEHLASWHAQRLRFGQKPPPLPQSLKRYAGTIHLDYRLPIETWRRALPDARLTLCSYDAALNEGGTVAHFCRSRNLPEPRKTSTAVNSGLHRAYVELARQANRSLSPKVAADFQTSLRKVPPASSLPRSGNVEMLGMEARARLTAHFAPIDEWLCGIAGQRVLPPLDHLQELRPEREIEANRAARDSLLGLRRMTLSRQARSFLRDIELAPNY